MANKNFEIKKEINKTYPFINGPFILDNNGHKVDVVVLLNFDAFSNTWDVELIVPEDVDFKTLEWGEL